MHQVAAARQLIGTIVTRVTFTSAVSSCIQSMLALTAVVIRSSAMYVAECHVIAMSLLLICRMAITAELLHYRRSVNELTAEFLVSCFVQHFIV